MIVWTLGAAWAGDRGDCANARRSGAIEMWTAYVLAHPDGACVADAFAEFVQRGAEPARMATTLAALQSPDPGARARAKAELLGLLAPPTHPEASTPRPPLPSGAELVAPPPEALRSPDGLAWWVLRPGDGGARPGSGDIVQVHYAVCHAEKGCFDDSWSRGKVAEFPTNAVVKGFAAAVMDMTVGEVRRVWVPPELGYGETPRSGVPAGLLVFDIALLGFHPR